MLKLSESSLNSLPVYEMKTSSSDGWVKDIDFILIPRLDENWNIFGITSVPLDEKTVIRSFLRRKKSYGNVQEVFTNQYQD